MIARRKGLSILKNNLTEFFPIHFATLFIQFLFLIFYESYMFRHSFYISSRLERSITLLFVIVMNHNSAIHKANQESKCFSIIDPIFHYALSHRQDTSVWRCLHLSFGLNSPPEEGFMSSSTSANCGNI